jgi:hypothetical protein
MSDMREWRDQNDSKGGSSEGKVKISNAVLCPGNIRFSVLELAFIN